MRSAVITRLLPVLNNCSVETVKCLCSAHI